jgi:cation diffusion facilitator CzcD-associated flavoprotein CzcO
MGSLGAAKEQHYDVLIIGAGLSGICSLCHIRERFPSWRVKVLEAGGGAGGTWYWNRYPGCRFDSDSVTYGFSFDKELLDEWHWKETFSPQPETLKYIERICEKNDLYGEIQFNTRVKSARWQDTDKTWLFTDEEGNQYSTRWFISCLGFLSTPTLPNIPGVESFQGEAFHTCRWPHDFDMSRDFGKKRIGIIGTGATGIQIITEVAKEPSIKSLHIFQRTANWSAPLRNSEITPEQMAKYKSEYDTMFRRCAETPLCFLYEADPRKSSEVTEEERLALWEKLYAEPGFAKWIGTFSDTYTDREANKLYSDFMEKKIRERVHDPVVADSLIPKDHGFGMRRLPLESGYFEAFNQPNIHLVDLRKTPIEKITPTGISTSDGKEHELDVLISATGFDAITGAFSPIDWQGKDNRPLLGTSDDEKGKQAVWVDFRPRTYLGILAPAMPNMFMVLGPHQPFGNVPRSIEHAVQVICDMLQYCKDNEYIHVEPTEEAVDEWTKHVVDGAKGSLAYEVDSWATGVNKNVSGKSVRTVAKYPRSAVEFRQKCEEIKSSSWKGLAFA